jgi:hypothetical protein
MLRIDGFGRSGFSTNASATTRHTLVGSQPRRNDEAHHHAVEDRRGE